MLESNEPLYAIHFRLVGGIAVFVVVVVVAVIVAAAVVSAVAMLFLDSLVALGLLVGFSLAFGLGDDAVSEPKYSGVYFSLCPSRASHTHTQTRRLFNVSKIQW